MVKLALLCMNLADRLSADAANVNDPLGDRVEQRAGALKGGRLPTRHDQQVARPRTLHAAADRRVKHRDTLLSGFA